MKYLKTNIELFYEYPAQLRYVTDLSEEDVVDIFKHLNYNNVSHRDILDFSINFRNIKLSDDTVLKMNDSINKTKYYYELEKKYIFLFSIDEKYVSYETFISCVTRKRHKLSFRYSPKRFLIKDNYSLILHVCENGGYDDFYTLPEDIIDEEITYMCLVLIFKNVIDKIYQLKYVIPKIPKHVITPSLVNRLYAYSNDFSEIPELNKIYRKDFLNKLK